MAIFPYKEQEEGENEDDEEKKTELPRKVWRRKNSQLMGKYRSFEPCMSVVNDGL